jgi:phosphatidylserine/phosphatidylglycerophosphate/cardiolipin synthase-like enzyme
MNENLQAQQTSPHFSDGTTAPRFEKPLRSGNRLCSHLIALLLGLALSVLQVHASASARVKTVEQLEAASKQHALVPCVFIKGDQARLYFTNAEQRVMFKADWDQTRVKVEDFTSQLATLKFDASPPPLPRPKDKWRAAKVLAYEDWEQFARSAVEGLAPSEAGHGLYLQFALGDFVLYRNAKGEIKAAPFADPPAGITVDRRLNRFEATAALASAVQTNLQAAYPQETAFALVTQSNAQHPRVILMDLNERRVVTLLVPQTGDDPRGGGGMGSGVSGLLSFVVVDHGWAILKNPVSSVGRLGNQLIQWPASLLNPRLHHRVPTVPALTNAPAMDLMIWEDWLDKHTGTKTEKGSVRLLIDGERFYPALEQRIKEANRSIDVHVCIFDRDDVGTRVAELLKQQSTNVEVRVIYDHTSTRTSGDAPPGTPMPEGFVPPKSIRHFLKEESRVHVRPFLNPFTTSDHRKIFVIDGQYAFLGGMNLGREYRYEWHDMMTEIQGPVVASLQWEFNKNWAHAGALGDLAYASTGLFARRPEIPGANTSDLIELRRLYTKIGHRQIRRAELECIRRAQDYVFLENPYLFDRTIVKALAEARLRGVDVRVVLPSQNDLVGGEGSNLVTANYLVQHGVRVYLYPGMTHIKAMLADGWVCYGSANFNTLSLRLNQEADIASSDAGLAERFKRELFETDFAKSYELKEPADVGWTDHLAYSIFNQF